MRNIVDKATKELSMEKTLKELDKTWIEMEFESEDHARTGLKLLKATEELIETLEDNQVLYNIHVHVHVHIYTCTCIMSILILII